MWKYDMIILSLQHFIFYTKENKKNDNTVLKKWRTFDKAIPVNYVGRNCSCSSSQLQSYIAIIGTKFFHVTINFFLFNRLKELSNQMEKQHDLLRLIVQKMEIRSEADDQDEGEGPRDKSR